MNDTILDYLEKFGDKSFERLPFGEVDALILSQFSYLKFDGIVPGPDDVTTYVILQYIKEHKDFDKLFDWYLHFCEKRELLGNTNHLLYICRKNV